MPCLIYVFNSFFTVKIVVITQQSMEFPPKCVTNTFGSKSSSIARKAILRLVDRFNRKYSKWNDYNAGRRCYQSKQG